MVMLSCMTGSGISVLCGALYFCSRVALNSESRISGLIQFKVLVILFILCIVALGHSAV